MIRTGWLILASAALLLSVVRAQAAWLETERPVAITKLLANIHPSGTQPGVVIASPQRAGPDYYFHWVRDAALTMSALENLLEEANTSGERDLYDHLMRDFAGLSLSQQGSKDAYTGLGEPKFEVDGSPYMGDWGRPQNDGPALRAITFIRYARWRLAHGQGISDLYDARIAAHSLIKTDLEYVSHHWREPSFDLWEESLGDHFYTRMVQRRALVDGAALARALGDAGAAAWYESQAAELSRALEQHWDGARGRIVATLNRAGGIEYKDSGLDMGVILGVLHGNSGDGFFSCTDARVQATAQQMIAQFSALYPVNHSGPSTAMGRYPEDMYAGRDFNGGNPWVLTTLAMAELSYCQYSQTKDPFFLDAGDGFAERVHRHANRDGSLSEQINRINGYMTSARDLTWNYAAVLTAAKARTAAPTSFRR